MLTTGVVNIGLRTWSEFANCSNMASDNQAVALEIQWDLVSTIEKKNGLNANAPSCMRQPAKTQSGLTDLIRKDNVVSQLYRGPILVFQNHWHRPLGKARELLCLEHLAMPLADHHNVHNESYFMERSVHLLQSP